MKSLPNKVWMLALYAECQPKFLTDLHFLDGTQEQVSGSQFSSVFMINPFLLLTEKKLEILNYNFDALTRPETLNSSLEYALSNPMEKPRSVKAQGWHIHSGTYNDKSKSFHFSWMREKSMCKNLPIIIEFK